MKTGPTRPTVDGQPPRLLALALSERLGLVHPYPNATPEDADEPTPPGGTKKQAVRPAFVLLGLASAAFALGAFLLTLLPINPDNFRVCSEVRTVVEDESMETPDVTTERSCEPISVSTGAPLAAFIVALALATPLLLGLVPPGGELKGPGGFGYKRALETTIPSEDHMWESIE